MFTIHPIYVSSKRERVIDGSVGEAIAPQPLKHDDDDEDPK